MMLSVPLTAMAQRDTISIIDWQFSRSTLTPETATKGAGDWKAVRLPHDYLVEQPWVAPSDGEKADNSDAAANVKSRLSARGFKEMGIGWYRRVFSPEASWKGRRVMLEFGGLLGSAPVMDIHPFSSAGFIHRGGRIPAPMHSLKN